MESTTNAIFFSFLFYPFLPLQPSSVIHDSFKYLKYVFCKSPSPLRICVCICKQTRVCFLCLRNYYIDNIITIHTYMPVCLEPCNLQLLQFSFFSQQSIQELQKQRTNPITMLYLFVFVVGSIPANLTNGL